MKTSYFIGLAILFVVLTLISGICELDYAKSTGSITLLESLMKPDIPSYFNPIGAVVAYVTVAWGYVQTLWSMLWFDYSFFTGGWIWIRYIFFIPVSLGLVLTLVLSVFRGVGSN